MRCREFNDRVVTLAEGGEDPSAMEHARLCEACAVRLTQLKRIIAVSKMGYWTTPSELGVQAQALMSSRTRLVARLLGSGLTHSGARRGGLRDFALHVGIDDFSIRLHYSPLREGWEVLGRAPTSDWTVAYQGGVLPCGASGRFRLLAPDLDSTDFVLSKDDVEIEIPSAQELTDVDA